MIFVHFVEYLVERMSDLLPSLERTVSGYNSYLANKKGELKVCTGVGIWKYSRVIG